MTRPPDASAVSWRQMIVAILYGGVCHIAFVVGVGTMIAAMFFGMSRSLGSLSAPWSLITNVILLAQFPMLHSLLLSGVGRKVLARLAPMKLGSRLSTTTYVIIASAQVFILFAFWTPSGIVWWQARGAVLWILGGLYASAWLLLLRAILDAGISLQTGFLGWWSVARRRAPVFPPMPTEGLFRLVRQPIYVAFALTLWTVPTWTPDQLAIAVLLTAYCLTGPVLKERRFRARFGADFLAYASRVPYWLPTLGVRVVRNDLSIYGGKTDWWGNETRWLRTLKNMVPVRFLVFDPIVGDWTGKRVLDLGCGGGFMSEALAARNARVTGIDPSVQAIDAARRHAEGGINVPEYLVASGEHLPFPEKSFDVVVCVDVLEHIADAELALDEIARVLRPGGVFLFDTINRNPLASLVVVTIGEQVLRLLPPGTHDPAMFIKPAELRRELEIRGFHVGKFQGFGPRWINRRFDIVFGRLPSLAVQYAGSAIAPI